MNSFYKEVADAYFEGFKEPYRVIRYESPTVSVSDFAKAFELMGKEDVPVGSIYVSPDVKDELFQICSYFVQRLLGIRVYLHKGSEGKAFILPKKGVGNVMVELTFYEDV